MSTAEDERYQEMADAVERRQLATRFGMSDELLDPIGPAQLVPSLRRLSRASRTRTVSPVSSSAGVRRRPARRRVPRRHRRGPERAAVARAGGNPAASVDAAVVAS